MRTKKISIIMPVFNAEKYVGQAIQSVIDQTYEDWELLVIDDGSTDRSVEIIKAFLSDFRIHLFEQVNSGVSVARNKGLKHMRGDYFCFLDADDKFSEKSLSTRLDILNDTEIMFADGAVVVFDKNMDKKIRLHQQNFEGLPLIALCKLDGSCFFGPTWMIRRIPKFEYKFVENLSHGEDLLFFIGIAHLGKYKASNEVIYHYRSGNYSAMSNLEGLENGYKSIYKFIKKMPSVPKNITSIFRKKYRSIMFKSYLKAKKPLQAIRVILAI